MTEFAKDKLLPSCVHGEAAPAAFQEALNNAITSFMLDKNAENFASALVEAAGELGPAAVGMLDFAGQTIKIGNPKISPHAPLQYVQAITGAGKLSRNFPLRAANRQSY